VESHERGSSACAQQWRGGGALMIARERGACCFICGRARRFTQRHSTDTSAAWARHGCVRTRSTAAMPLDRRRTGRSAWPRRAWRVAQGEWGKGRRCGARGSHSARTGGPRPASAGVYSGGRGGLRGAHVATPHASARALAFQGKTFRTSPVPLRFSQDF
jgi:hypothetical protein